MAKKLCKKRINELDKKNFIQKMLKIIIMEKSDLKKKKLKHNRFK